MSCLLNIDPFNDFYPQAVQDLGREVISRLVLLAFLCSTPIQLVLLGHQLHPQFVQSQSSLDLTQLDYDLDRLEDILGFCWINFLLKVIVDQSIGHAFIIRYHEIEQFAGEIALDLGSVVFVDVIERDV